MSVKKIAIGQINSTIGDFSGNIQKILNFSSRAHTHGSEIIVFPELALCGYPPMDLLEHPAFVQENIRSLDLLRKLLPPDIAVVLGHASPYSGSSDGGSGDGGSGDGGSGDGGSGDGGRALQNSVSVLLNGEIVHRQAKTLLPTYDVFDETRYFEPAHDRKIWKYRGSTIGIAICEDIWWEEGEYFRRRGASDPIQELLEQKIDLLLVPSASPFHSGKRDVRKKLLSIISSSGKIPVVYVNMTGANDSLIFDGYSLVFNGRVSAMGAGFREELLFHNPSAPPRPASGSSAAEGNTAAGAIDHHQNDHHQCEKYEDLRQALCLGISDYLKKTGFERVHLGLSGGVDSALVLTLAVQALGADKVMAFMLPSRYSSPGSIHDSENLCRNLGIEPDTISIDSVYDSFAAALSSQFAGTAPGIAEENLQARIRGTILMAWSNKFKSLLLTTGNKSELSVGYCTLYGDMSGALAVIGDVFKTEVYELCEHINRSNRCTRGNSGGDIIPREILTKEPSAELRPDQKDQDSLPPYRILDDILRQYFLQRQSAPAGGSEGIDDGMDDGNSNGTLGAPLEPDPELVRKIITMIARAEYKRYQAPPVLKVSPKAFGSGRRIPIARSFYENF